MKKEEVSALIMKVGVVPVVRARSPEEALFAAQAIAHGGIPIVEITMTVPGAIEVIAELVRTASGVLVGAGTVTNAEAAHKCIEAGAKFLVSPGFNARTYISLACAVKLNGRPQSLLANIATVVAE